MPDILLFPLWTQWTLPTSCAEARLGSRVLTARRRTGVRGLSSSPKSSPSGEVCSPEQTPSGPVIGSAVIEGIGPRQTIKSGEASNLCWEYGALGERCPSEPGVQLWTDSHLQYHSIKQKILGLHDSLVSFQTHQDSLPLPEGDRWSAG